MEFPVSPIKDYCTGIVSSPNMRYVTGIALSVAKVKRTFEHHGSVTLDFICAFDKAEASDIYLGQTNMIYVSSFCSPNSYIWGYNLARSNDLEKNHELLGDLQVTYGKTSARVFSAQPLISAFRDLIGTRSKKVFPFYPGTHLPAAGKSIEMVGPANIYSAIGIGICSKGDGAHTFMEDIGTIPLLIEGKDVESYKSKILRDLAKSVMTIGEEQQIIFDKVYVEIISMEINEDEVGSGLVVAPYFNIPINALPDGDFAILEKMTIDEWRKQNKRK